jgi:hypothetical protein
LYLYLPELDYVPANLHSSSKSLNTPNAAEADPQFFSHVEGDVEKILRKEKIQEEYQKVSTTPSCVEMTCVLVLAPPTINRYIWMYFLFSITASNHTI